MTTAENELRERITTLEAENQHIKAKLDDEIVRLNKKVDEVLKLVTGVVAVLNQAKGVKSTILAFIALGSMVVGIVVKWREIVDFFWK